MHINKKCLAMVASSTLLVNALFTVPALAASSTEISGNGSYSTNSVNTSDTSSNTVVQDNKAKITNEVDANANTGGNFANANTGGNVSVLTGNASSAVTVKNQANLNSVNLPDCGCSVDNTTLKVAGNGADSFNHVNTSAVNTVSAFQNNHAGIHNMIHSDASTGYNDANKNTGGTSGNTVTVLTGDATSNVGVSNAANVNLFNMTSPITSAAGSTSATVSGNGADSTNIIHLAKDNATSLVQGNSAWVDNYLSSHAKTGYNDANKNTGEDVLVGTGNANSSTTVSTLANFNAMSAGCGCTMDLSAKVAGNGADSYNTISKSLTDTNSIFQGGPGAGNTAYVKNKLHSDPQTGDNNGSKNTNYTGDGVGVLTGDATSNTGVSTSTNTNLVGADLSSLMSGNFQLEFNLADLFGMLH